MRYLLVPILFVLPLFLSSCWMRGCTADDCIDRAVIYVRAERWSAGLYRFEGSFDGRSFTCEMELPWTEESTAPTCDTEEITLGAPSFGELPPPGSEGLIDIHYSRPTAIEIRVLHDGTELVAQTVAPDYERVTAGCDQVCRYGDAALDLP